MPLLDRGGNGNCNRCGLRVHKHDRIRVYHDGGPPGSWHWVYECPEGAA